MAIFRIMAVTALARLNSEVSNIDKDNETDKLVPSWNSSNARHLQANVHTKVATL